MDKDLYINYHHAIANDDLKHVKELVKEQNLNIDTPHPQLASCTPLYHAATARAYEVLDYLLTHKVKHDPNFTFELAFGGNFATTEQRREGERQFIKLHKKHQFPLDATDGLGNSLLHIAASNGSLSFLEYIYNEIGHKHPKNHKKNTALHAACLAQSTEAIDFFAHKEDPLINDKNDNGDTALHLAISAKMPLDNILKHPKIDANIKAENGSAPLHLTALSYPSGKRALLESGKCDLNVQDINGMTPLHYLLLANYFYAVKPLIDMGANPNITDKNGYTALAFALKHTFTRDQEVDTAFEALSAKCDPYIRNKNGKDCFDLARHHKNPEMHNIIDHLRIENRVKKLQDQAKVFKKQRQMIKIKRRQPKP